VPVVWCLVRRKNIQTTKHVEACLEASRDGGSNPPASILSISTIFLLTKTYAAGILPQDAHGSNTGVSYGFYLCKEKQRGKTWYVGYYVNGRFLRKRVGRSKAIAEKASAVTAPSNLRPTLPTIIRSPNQPLITNRTPSNEANCFARGILGTDQQN
jgi:hypothetical protein